MNISPTLICLVDRVADANPLTTTDDVVSMALEKMPYEVFLFKGDREKLMDYVFECRKLPPLSPVGPREEELVVAS